MAFHLQHLPAETLHAIASILPARDIKSLRLVSRTLVSIASEFLFETVFVEVLPESLEKLSFVTLHPVFSKSVRTIFFSPRMFQAVDALEDFKRICFRDLLREEESHRIGIDYPADLNLSEEQWANYHKNYDFWAHVQQDLAKTTTVEIGLHEAVARLPKLREVLTSYFYDPLETSTDSYFHTSALKKVLRYTLLHPTLSSGGYSAQACRTLISAVACAKAVVTVAWFEAVEESFLDRATIEVPHVHCALFHLENLQINLCVRYSLSPAKANNLRRVLSFMPMLRELNLSVSGDEDAFIPFRVLVMDLPWTHLKFLFLEQVVLQEEQLITFITAHQPTMRWIELQNCPLETGSWSSVHQKLLPFFPASKLGSDETAKFNDPNAPDEFFHGSYWLE